MSSAHEEPVVQTASIEGGCEKARASQHSRRRTSVGRVARRLSVHDREFLNYCLGGGGSEDEYQSASSFATSSGEYASAEEGKSLPDSPASDASEEQRRRKIFYAAMNGQSDSEDDEGSGADGLEAMFKFEDIQKFGEDSSGDEGDSEDLEDLYCFDLERVALALRSGASREELSQVIEELMTEGLERRLESEDPASVFALQSPAASPATPSGEDVQLGFGASSGAGHDRTSGRSTPNMGSLSGLMTPAQLGEGEMSPAPSAEEISDRLQVAFVDIPERRRQSTAMQHSRLAGAVHEAVSRRRASLHSLALACAEDCASGNAGRRLSCGAMRSVMMHESRRHRKTLIKAAEVLEVAGIGVDGRAAEAESNGDGGIQSSVRDLNQQLLFVQGAMKSAQRRHRQSVAQAVQAAAGCADLGRRMPCQSLAAEKVQQIIARAYAKRQQAQEAEAAAARSKQVRGLPTPMGQCGSIVALMHARSGDAGMKKHTVHIGPAFALSSQNRRGCAVRK